MAMFDARTVTCITCNYLCNMRGRVGRSLNSSIIINSNGSCRLLQLVGYTDVDTLSLPVLKGE